MKPTKIINPSDYRIAIHTTLNRLKDAGACTGSYKKLVKALGGTAFGHDTPINLLTILDHNGVEDCIWALSATVENCDVAARLMACDFAESVLPIWSACVPDDGYVSKCIRASRLYAVGLLSMSKMREARDATWDARDAAWAAARDAAQDTAQDAAWAAARDAARATSTKEEGKQKLIVLRYLLAD